MDSFDLKKIISELREKCPWDRKQTISSLKKLTLEETYELCDAIDSEDFDNLEHELGDLLMHIYFYAQIAKEKGKFEIENVYNSICERLIERHPHIYGDEKADTEEEVKALWEKSKLKKSKNSQFIKILPHAPALHQAQRVQEKVAGVGFDWDTIEPVWGKIYEEIKELKEAISNKDRENIEEEFGDLMFSMVNLGRKLELESEQSLNKSNLKFVDRFTKILKKIEEEKKDITKMSLEDMDSYWNKVKTNKV